MALTPACKYILIMAAISFLSTFVGRLLPYRWFPWDRFPYQSWPFEKEGRIYLKLKINKWHKKVPDMSRIFKKLFPAKSLEDCTADKLRQLISETCVAEFVHGVLCVIGWLLGRVWKGRGVKALTWLYVLANQPFILIQRYNRPRLVRMLKRMQMQEMSVNRDKSNKTTASAPG